MKPEKSFTAVRVIVAVVVLAFILFAFFIPQPCDIDKIYLWCRVHPFSTADLIGCILFYAGAAVLAGVPQLFGIELYEGKGSSALNIATFVAIAAGLLLIWNL